MSELADIRKRLSDLETKFGNVTEKKPRAPREPSEYNIFMKEYFAKNKDPKKSHKDLFGDAAKAWSEAKTKKK